MKQFIQLKQGFAYLRNANAAVYGPLTTGELMDRTTVVITDENFESVMLSEGTINLNDGTHTTNTQSEELTMTTNTTTTATVVPTFEDVRKAGTTREKAELLASMILADQQPTATKKGLIETIKEKAASAWTAIKEYDYKGALSNALDAVSNAHNNLDIWLSNTKTGRTVSYLTGATTAMTVVGFFLSPLATVVVGAALYTGFKAYGSGKAEFTVGKFFKDCAINAVLFALIATVAFFTMPYVYLAVTYLYYAAVLALLIPGAAILF